MINVQNWVTNWVNRMGQAGATVQAGVAAVTVAPGTAAVAAKDKMKARWLAVMATNVWDQKTSAVTLQQWQQAMTTKGIPRMADGATAARAKLQAYATKAAPLMAQLQAQIKAMASTTDSDNEARMLAWSRGMKALKPQLAA